MESAIKIAQLQSERHQVIAISETIASDLRTLRISQDLAKTPQETAIISKQHRRALQAYARAQQRLRELNASIKWHNMATQEQIRQQAKREKEARRKELNRESNHA